MGFCKIFVIDVLNEEKVSKMATALTKALSEGNDSEVQTILQTIGDLNREGKDN